MYIFYSQEVYVLNQIRFLYEFLIFEPFIFSLSSSDSLSMYPYPISGLLGITPKVTKLSFYAYLNPSFKTLWKILTSLII